jgi:hypothetical protein
LNFQDAQVGYAIAQVGCETPPASVEPPASMRGRQVGLKRLASGPGKTWAETQGSSLSSRALFGWQTSITMPEDLLRLLFCCYLACLITIKLNSISQSHQSSWKTICKSRFWESFRLKFNFNPIAVGISKLI